MMKLLLTTIQSKCIDTRLSLNHLYSVVAQAPCETTVLEFDEQENIRSAYGEILRGEYNILYFHCNVENEEKILTLVEMVKKAIPTAITVVGGLSVSFDTRKYMERCPEIDYVFRGEGENVLYQFFRTIFTYEFDFASIAGLAYRDSEEIRINPMAAPVRFDALPFPYEEAELEESDVVFYESIRGCPDHCDYIPNLPGKTRSLSLNRICTELRYFLVKNVRMVRFLDKWFNYDRNRAYRIWEYLINNDNGITSFEFDINGDLLDEETIRLLSTARDGQFHFRMDVVSTNAEALAAAGRKANIYQLMYNASRLIQYGNIEITAVLLAGLPCETAELFARSFNKVYALHADALEIHPLRLYRGTKIRKDADQYGYVYRNDPPYEVLSNDFMPAMELFRIQNIAELVDRYVTQGGFDESIPRMLEDAGIKPFAFFSGLEKYITDNRLWKKLSRQEDLYRILYGYAVVLYDQINETLKIPVIMEIIHSDLEQTISYDRVKKFDKKGWELNA